MARTKKTKPTIIVEFILDRSGSMESIKESTIKGFNEYLQGLKAKKQEVLFSLTIFDTQSIEHLYKLTPVKAVKPLNSETFVPRAGTPLYDAVVETLEKAAKDIQELKNTAVLAVILTDGEENSSTKHDASCVRDLVKKLEKKGNWTFLYLGANQDAWKNASVLAMDTSNAVKWESTRHGSTMAFFSLTDATDDFTGQVNAAYVSGNTLKATNLSKNFIPKGGGK